MKKYFIINILCILANFVYAQECPDVAAIATQIQDKIENTINAKIIDSKISNSYRVLKLDLSVAGFNTLANACKTYGHKAGGSLDNWKQLNRNTAEYYMFDIVDNSKVHLYYEEINEQMYKPFQQYLPKGIINFDKNKYNEVFGNIDFSQNHWKAGGDVDKRFADMRNLAVAIGNKLGITIDPNKIIHREVRVPNSRILFAIPEKDDKTKGLSRYDGFIEIDKKALEKDISTAVSTVAEEVYHQFQMSKVEKYQQELKNIDNLQKRIDTEKDAGKGLILQKQIYDATQLVPEKVRDWNKSFIDNNKNDYGKKYNELNKQYRTTGNANIKDQRDNAGHSYYQLAHEKDAKEFAGHTAAIEYFVRNVRPF